MPRDNKGNVFGHGSVMQDAKGHQITVEGFATVRHGRIDIEKLTKAIGGHFTFYRWTDLHNVNANEKSLAGLDTTDHCAVDRAQVADGTPAVASRAAQDDGGDKVIWGT